MKPLKHSSQFKAGASVVLGKNSSYVYIVRGVTGEGVDIMSEGRSYFISNAALTWTPYFYLTKTEQFNADLAELLK